jgi:FKBP-type peptidyl-prolyl cis-trans isomerase 2
MSISARSKLGASQPADPTSLGPEVVVRLEYRLYDAEGELVEAPGPEEAMEFLFGVGQAPAALERAIEGLRVGQSRRVQLRPDDAFGRRDEAALIEVDATELPEGATPGDEFEAEREDGQLVFLRVVELEQGVATLDANHPLAGQTVTLELSVLALRAASSDQLRAAELALTEREVAEAPHVLASRLLRRSRSTPAGSAGR